MNGDSKRVLVLDADGQAALSLIRSLGQQGVSVTAGSPRRFSLGRLSRYSDAAYLSPDPEAFATRYLSHLLDYLEATDREAVIPIRDHTSVLCAKHKAELEETGATVATEDWETFERTYEKGQLFALAESLSVPTPETFIPTGLADLEANAAELSYPAVVKPRSKTVWSTSKGRSRRRSSSPKRGKSTRVSRRNASEPTRRRAGRRHSFGPCASRGCSPTPPR